MEQIRQILSQLALHLELNIAMCDKLDDVDKRLEQVELRSKENTKMINAQRTSLSELRYKLADDSYKERTGSRNKTERG